MNDPISALAAKEREYISRPSRVVSDVDAAEIKRAGGLDAYHRQQNGHKVDRVEIELTHDEHILIERSAAALAKHPQTFSRGGEPVHVSMEDGQQGGIYRPEPSPRIRRYTPASIREPISETAYFVRVTENAKGEQARSRASMPRFLPGALVDRGHWQGMRELCGVVTAPVLRPDGSLHDRPGFDPATNLLFQPTGKPITVPATPTREDALKALSLLLEVVVDFPFATPAHRAAWLAFPLSIAGRPAYSGPAPLFLADASTPGSGKTLAMEAGAMIPTGRALPKTTFQADDAEMRKSITSVAIAGDPVVVLDNLDCPLGSAALDAALTSTTWRDRVLGVSRMFEGPIFTVWCATGNNVQVKGDTSRRVVHIRLDAREERPEERTGFRHADLLSWVRHERHRLAAACLTILRAYIVAGRPQAALKPWGSFEGWSSLIRQSLVWLGQPDPAETKRELLEAADRVGPMLRGILNGLMEMDPYGQGMTASQIVGTLTDNPTSYGVMRDSLAELCNVPAAKLEGSKVGYRLRRFVRRVCGEHALVKDQNREGVTVWRVRRVSGTAGDEGHEGHA